MKPHPGLAASPPVRYTFQWGEERSPPGSFLVEVQPSDLAVALDRIAAGDFALEPHNALRVGLGEDVMVAFNDLAPARQPGKGSLAGQGTCSPCPSGPTPAWSCGSVPRLISSAAG